ncbi:MAG TPA: peptidylprolyl isomerase [Chromatiaceae bacterium]|jgi:FKBP-type peptidyl-prolyl cis-trans isomerase SlpA|nr:peptidylprolyl isomerase [Chromatiaceae bacterium]HIN82188.1 peptidylprolyl isomerase [Chromatiales bacterium]HIA07521.1 peptidylprolyl isomerase [Chromatiaceae bacterium]HIB85446.1 peptidylprolyl isomerase [Chromatiaceae bacterium]HIO14750.1 peptidylprolyl isomerase [Chromatiales bacterium]
MPDNNRTITQLSPVTLNFSITLEDGTVADTTDDDDPISFVMGDGTLIEGLELALLGLKAGDAQSIGIDPVEGFGFPEPGNIHDIPRDRFDLDETLEIGQMIGFTTEDGGEIAGIIRSMNDADVTVDFNHPLAGHRINFWVEILEVGEPEHIPPETLN